MTLRLRYLTLKLRALCWAWRRLRLSARVNIDQSEFRRKSGGRCGSEHNLTADIVLARAPATTREESP
jgi:hypothetical protein